MAVPNEAYQTYSLRDTVSGTQRQVFKFAKLTSPYSTVADAKTLFKLDGVINEGTSSFIGYVEKNSANYIFHSPLRMDSYLFGDSHILLTDGGLNRMADKPVFQVQTGNSTTINVITNSIFLRALFNSSYYNVTTAHYIDVAESENLNVTVSTDSLGTINQNTSKQYTGDEIIVPDDMIFYVGKTYPITLRAVNEEGAISSSVLSLSPAPGAVNLKFGSTLDAAIASQAASTVYINRRITDAEDSSDGVVFYSNLEATGYVSTGYYLSVAADELGHYKYYRVTNSSGRVTEINSIVSRHQDVYYYYSAISAADAISGHSPSEIVLYYKVEITPPDSDFENRTYFNGTFVDSGYATQGYYVKEDRTTSIYVGANGSAEVLIG